MKILHLDSFDKFGGGQKRYLNISKFISLQGHELLLVSKKNAKVNEYFPGKVYTAPYLGDIDIFTFLKILYVIAKEKPDIIHTHSHHDHWMGCLATRIFRKPMLVHTRHVDFSVGFNKISRFMYVRCPVHAFTSCKSIKDTMIRSLGADPLFDPNKFQPILTFNYPEKWGTPGKIREEFNIDKATRCVSTITRIVDNKGHRFLLEAIPLITKKIKDIVFFIVGEGPYLTEIKRLAGEIGVSDRVIFTGFRDDIWDFYADMDLSVFPTLNEGIAPGVMESLFYEVPVAASRIGGIPEIIEDGVNGVMFEPRDPAQIADTVIKMFNNRDMYDMIKKNCAEWRDKKAEEPPPGQRMADKYSELLLRKR